CLQPAVCPNLNADHRPLIELYNAVDKLPGVKKSCIGSGIRYDLIMHPYDDDGLRKAAMQYAEELISRHVSGRLKVAPEHTEDEVLRLMRKPSFGLFEQFRQHFEQVCRRNHLNQQIIPYFISSHPGCSEADMAALAAKTKHQGFELEQVQDFTPTPMTLATEIYYTGLNPYTMKPVYTAHSKEDKLAQRQFFFWYKPEYRAGIIKSLRRIGHPELIDRLLGQRSFGRQQTDTHRSNGSADSTQRRPSRRR
ncbi:MAG: DUF3362 domain-containing protein, partial [Paludibacteraceae bacterium]|nr:DUF3362 domain-containing protein [Paludibacteraceae bacterium]